MEQLEDELKDLKPEKPTPFDAFCQTKLNQFRSIVAQQMSARAPVSAKLQRLVDLIVNLHKPTSRGQWWSTYNCSMTSVHKSTDSYLAGLILVRTKCHTLALRDFLEQHPKIKERKISVGRLTGQGPSEDLCLPGTQQATVLSEFRKGSFHR